MNDDELERVMRTGLERRAAAAEVDVAVVDRARRAARGRRTNRLAVVGAAAAAVVVTGVVAVAMPSDDDSAPAPGATDSAEPLPDEWRTEYWHDVQVDVPADWGWRTTPNVCGGPPASRGYVGRPIASTDVCVSVDRDAEPTAPYVWFDGGVVRGTVDLGGGWIRETVEANGSRVSVATTDPDLRRRILDSVTGGEVCLSHVPVAGPLEHGRAADPTARPTSLRVCVYDFAASYRTADLAYAITLGRQPAEEYLAAVAAGDSPRDQCPTIDYQLEQAVLIELLDAGGAVLRQDAVNTTSFCAGVAVDAPRLWVLETTRLTAAMVRPWAVAGIPAVVSGPPEFGLIGQQG